MQGVPRRRDHGGRTGSTCFECAGVPQLESNRMQLAEQPEARAGVAPLRAQLGAWLRAGRNTSVRLLRAGALGRRRAGVSDAQSKAWRETLGQVVADLDL